MLCIICGVYRFRQKQLKEDPQWQMTLPRSRASSRTNLKAMGSGHPDDDSDTDGMGTLKKSRSYDKVYRTNEPLPGKPRIDFPAKKWDLDHDDEDVTSSEGSENKDTKLAKDIQYINKTGDKPKQMGRRSLRGISGSDQDQHSPTLSAEGHDDHEGVGEIHPAGYHQPPSPEVDDHHDEHDDLHGIPMQPTQHLQQQAPPQQTMQPQHQYSPTFSGVDSRNSAASSMSYQPNAANQTRFGGVPVLPNANSQYFNRPPSAMPAGAAGIVRPAPIVGGAGHLTQESGLPSPPMAASPTPSQNQRSTEV